MDSTMQIENIPIAQINFAPYNPRKELRPKDDEWQQIKGSIEKYGVVQNIVWNKRTGNLVGGHQRTRVGTKEWGWTTIPCVVVDLPEDEERALNLILNRVGEGLWDEAKLAEVLSDLRAGAQIDLASLGFRPDELERLLKQREKATRREPDAEAPAPPSKPVTRPGDRYAFITGDAETQHILQCGDSCQHSVIQAAMGDARARMIFTDPPYGVSYVSQSATAGKMNKKEVTNDELRGPVLQEFLQKAFGAMAAGCMTNPTAYVFYASRCHREFRNALEGAGWEERQQLLWIKQMALGRSDYHWSHEPMFYCARHGGKTEWFGTRAEKTLFENTEADIAALKKEEAIELLLKPREGADTWDIARDAPSTYVHPTQKPIALAQRAMRNSTMMKDHVLDPFAGSGSTMVAGEIACRNTHSVEIDPSLCDVIAHRFVLTFTECVVTKNNKEVNPDTLR